MDAFEKGFREELEKIAKKVKTEKKSLLTRPLGLLAALKKRVRKK